MCILPCLIKLSHSKSTCVFSLRVQYLVCATGEARSEHPSAALLRVVGEGAGASGGYGQGDLEIGMFCLIRTGAHVSGISASQCPILLGKTLRIVHESSAEYAVVECWRPIMKADKFGENVNLFGTWLPSASPTGDSGKKRATVRSRGTAMVPLHDVVVWPVDLEPGASEYPDGRRIPFSACHHLRDSHNIDLAHPCFTFADRGKAFYAEVVAHAAQSYHDTHKPTE